MVIESYYSPVELEAFGFRQLGTNVKISRKASIYGADTISVGSNVRIDDFCILSGNLALGSYVHIAAYTALYGSTEGIRVEDFSNISARVCIYAVSDDYSGESMTNPLVPARFKNVQHAPVLIKRHVIIGSGCTVLPGVTLEEGAAFGAMTLINHDAEPWSINAGIPFRRLRARSRRALELETELLRETEGR